MEEDEEVVFKILILGNQNVGKTSFIQRYCEDKFDENQLASIGVDLKTKSINRHKRNILLKIFDTAGQEKFHSISKNYFKSSDGIILLYDISCLKSFQAIKSWIDSIKEVVDLDEIGFILLGNKSDLPEENKEVSNLMKEDLEKELRIKIMETSVKDNINIEESFNKLIDKIYELRFGIKLNNTLEKMQTIKLNKKGIKSKKHNCFLSNLFKNKPNEMTH